MGDSCKKLSWAFSVQSSVFPSPLFAADRKGLVRERVCNHSSVRIITPHETKVSREGFESHWRLREVRD